MCECPRTQRASLALARSIEYFCGYIHKQKWIHRQNRVSVNQDTGSRKYSSIDNKEKEMNDEIATNAKEESRGKGTAMMNVYGSDEKEESQSYVVTKEIIKIELKELIRLTWPIVLQMGSQQVMLAADLIFVGRLGRFEMTVGSLFTVLFLLCWYFLAGLTSAMDTLASQAHGANDARAVKSWTIVCFAVVSVACFPAAAFLFSSEAIVKNVLKRSDAIAREVGRACVILFPGLWFMSWALVYQKYLQMQGRVNPVGITSFLTLMLNIGLNQLFIHELGMGLQGAPIATTISRFANLCFLFIYSVGSSYYETHEQRRIEITEWIEAKKAITKKMFMRAANLSFHGGLMLASEAWAFEVTVITTSMLGMLELDAHNALLSVCGLSFMTGPMAFGIAASIRVGNLLGINKPNIAHTAARMYISVGLAWMVLTSILISIFARHIGNLYTDGDHEIADLVVKLAPLAATFQVFDALLGICNGVLRACGRQRILALTNMCALWGVGVTLGTSLAFATSLRVRGVWIGLTAGVIASGSSLATMVHFVDWKVEAEKAKESAVNKTIEDTDVEA